APPSSSRTTPAKPPGRLRDVTPFTKAIAVVSLVCATHAGAQAPEFTPPRADLTVTLRDHNFKLSNPVPAGHATWHVRNEGTEPHQALVIRLPDRVSEFAEKAWLE